MNLGASGVLNLMNSLGGLKSAGTYWSAGDRVLFIVPVQGVDANGKPVIPVAHRFGHRVDFGEQSSFKRSFVPTTSEVDLTTNSPKEPDFAYRVSSLLNAILKGERARAEEAVMTDVNIPETAKKIELENIEKNFKNRSSAVGFFSVKAYTEVLVAKLDANLRFVGDKIYGDYASLALSKKKLGQMLEIANAAGNYIEGTNYVYFYMDTPAGAKKAEAAQAPWKSIEDPNKRLETVYGDAFTSYVKEIFESKNPTPESIGAKVYDFKPYDEKEFKSAVAEYVAERAYMLKNRTGTEYLEIAQNERVALALEELNLVQDAHAIKALIADTAEVESQKMVEELGNTAQSVDLSDIAGGQFAGQAQ